ncbi:MAG: class I SAM-dependent methyltransferase [Rhodospirillaceae bacterium]|nr:class I SAM-dependent methyltransferase [Rhodospirillaceae bacterium]
MRDPGSFRDPSGHVYDHEGRILRTVMPPAAESYRALRDSGLLADLTARGLLLPAQEIDPATVNLTGPLPAHLLEHPRLPFVSYPYEWGFASRRAAALKHLDLHLAALDKGFTLSDASAYNIQFRGPEPVFIDHLSLRPYRPGEIWAGHRQFCMQFLNPLLLEAKLDISPQAWLRGQIEGIDPGDLAKMLRWKHRLSWTILAHVFLQARFQSGALGSARQSEAKLKQAQLPLPAFRNMLVSLRDFISGLVRRGGQTVWSDYAGHTSYADAETELKRAFVAAMVDAVKPARLIDLGCNTGDYSALALAHGAGTVIGFDFDLGALDQAFARAQRDRLSFLPLWLDAASPSPDQGWAQRERKGFAARARVDGLLALALLHHLVIGRNIPMDDAVEWLMAMAPQGVIEFVPKSDPMVQRLLALREDIFPAYDEAAFRAAVERRGRLLRAEQLSPSGRLLIWYERTGGAA